ncbi:MAG: hypothetical protein GY782_10950 [Gammaproteobacteria bacterium]|nr:hypothetical protein [Gammaproteobacteria bacterium]
MSRKVLLYLIDRSKNNQCYVVTYTNNTLPRCKSGYAPRSNSLRDPNKILQTPKKIFYNECNSNNGKDYLFIVIYEVKTYFEVKYFERQLPANDFKLCQIEKGSKEIKSRNGKIKIIIDNSDDFNYIHQYKQQAFDYDDLRKIYNALVKHLNKEILEAKDNKKDTIFAKCTKQKGQVENIMTTVTDDGIAPGKKKEEIEKFHKSMNGNRISRNPRKYGLIAGFIAACLGFVVGAVVGAAATSWTGPGAILGALAGGIVGGVGIGADVYFFKARAKTSQLTHDFVTKASELQPPEGGLNPSPNFSGRSLTTISYSFQP